MFNHRRKTSHLTLSLLPTQRVNAEDLIWFQRRGTRNAVPHRQQDAPAWTRDFLGRWSFR